MAKRSTAKKAATRKRTTKKTAAKKSTARKTAKRGSQKRELLKNRAGASFAKRSGDGTFKEMDARGRSLSADRRVKARKASKSGFGDTGDRKKR
jgi:hypothetical protein